MSGLKKMFATKQLRIKFLFAALVGALVGTYLGAFIHYMIAALDFSLSPFDYIRHAVETGNSPALFCVFFALFCVTIVFLAMLRSANAMYTDERGVTYSKDGTYGTAKPATPKELSVCTNIKPVEQCTGMIFGKLDTTTKKCVERKPEDVYGYNKNVFIAGAAGAGKTSNMIITAVLQTIKQGHSGIITDTKGTVYNQTVSIARANGYTVRVFSPKDPSKSHCWNCMRELMDENGNINDARASTFAEAVILNTVIAAKSGGIFVTGAIALLKAALLFVMSSPLYGNGPGQKPRTFANAFRLTQGKTEDEIRELFRGPCSDEAKFAYSTIDGSSPNLRGNLGTNLGTALHSLNDLDLDMLTSVDEIDLTLPAKRQCIYYVIIPDNERSKDFYTSLFYTFLFRNLTEFADSQDDERCPVPVDFIMDEFANSGVLPGFDNYVSSVRSRAIQIAFAVQDIPQLERMYPETWKSILSNCSYHLGLRFNDPETAKYFSDRSGIATIKTTSERHPAGQTLRSPFHTETEASGKRPVYTVDELYRLSRNVLILNAQELNSIIIRKMFYKEHPYASQIVPSKPQAFPSHKQPELRKLVIALEEERVRQYDLWSACGKVGPAPKVLPYDDVLTGKISIEDYRKMASSYTLDISDGDTFAVNVEQDDNRDTSGSQAPVFPAAAIEFASCDVPAAASAPIQNEYSAPAPEQTKLQEQPQVAETGRQAPSINILGGRASAALPPELLSAMEAGLPHGGGRQGRQGKNG